MFLILARFNELQMSYKALILEFITWHFRRKGTDTRRRGEVSTSGWRPWLNKLSNRVVTQRSSPLTATHSSSAFHSLCYWEPTSCMQLLRAAPIIFFVTFADKDQVSRKWKPAPYWSIWGKRMQSSSEQPFVGGSLRDGPSNGCEGD